MSAAPRYDRKARLALGVLGVLFVAPLAISLHNCVSTVQSRNEVIAAAAAGTTTVSSSLGTVHPCCWIAAC